MHLLTNTQDYHHFFLQGVALEADSYVRRDKIDLKQYYPDAVKCLQVDGKLTTDPHRHTGEGIFFTSRAFDCFEIRSGELRFSRRRPDAPKRKPALSGCKVNRRRAAGFRSRRRSRGRTGRRASAGRRTGRDRY